MSVDTTDNVRNALNTLIDQRVKAATPVVAPVEVKNEIPVPTVEVHNDIPVPEVSVSVDMKPVARALSVLVKGLQEIEERQLKHDKTMLALLKGIAELQEKGIEATAELTKELKKPRKSTGKFDRETGKITVERS